MKKEIDKMPNWYWKKGLYDSIIINISQVILEYDYTQQHPEREYCSIVLDSSKALYDTSVKEIRFINAKGFVEDKNYKGYWWVEDDIEMMNNNKYKISITVRNKKIEEKIIIQCDDVTIVRRGAENSSNNV